MTDYVLRFKVAKKELRRFFNGDVAKATALFEKKLQDTIDEFVCLGEGETVYSTVERTTNKSLCYMVVLRAEESLFSCDGLHDVAQKLGAHYAFQAYQINKIRFAFQQEGKDYVVLYSYDTVEDDIYVDDDGVCHFGY